MSELMRIMKIELMKSSKIFYCLLSAMIFCGTVFALLINRHGDLPMNIVLNFITNTSLIIFITPVVIDYCYDISVGYFQDAISFGISRNKLFVVKIISIVLKSICMLSVMYISIFITNIILGVENNVIAINYIRLFLFSLCLIFMAITVAVILENMINTTIVCVVLSMGLKIISALFADTWLNDMYIFGKSNLIFEKNIDASENRKFILCAVITAIILIICSIIKFRISEFRTSGYEKE